MNKKVLKTMIALVGVFLIACYVLKIFFPQQFIMVIENDQIVKIGNYIDSNLWAQILVAIVTSFIIYWFFLCASLRKWYLDWKQILVVLVVIGITQGLYEYDPTLSSAFSLVAMLGLPVIFKADLKASIITFCCHYAAQTLSTQIRQLPMLLTNVNSATILLMTVECYFWLLLFYLFYNYKEKKV